MADMKKLGKIMVALKKQNPSWPQTKIMKMAWKEMPKKVVKK
jgi:hypothetical protein